MKKAQLKTKKLKTSRTKFLTVPEIPRLTKRISKISSLQLPRNLEKRGQLKIQQMAFMLIAVTLFFVLVGMFVLVIKFAGLKESATTLEEENAMLLVTKIANSPEFSCGGAFGNDKTNCIDADKVMMLKENIGKYENFWGVGTNIEIRKIYPETNEEIICNLKKYPGCNIINLQSKEMPAEYSNFVSLCRKESFEGKVYDKCELAKVMISYKDWRTEQ